MVTAVFKCFLQKQQKTNNWGVEVWEVGESKSPDEV